MSSETSMWDIPYSLGSDDAASIDETMQALAERLDELMGETGETSITPSAVDTATAKAIAYSRTYTDVPRVMLGNRFGLAVANIVNLWVTNETTTGFTLNIRANSTTARDVRWVARPQAPA